MDNDDHHHVELFEALVALETAEDARNFLADLCTPVEIKAFVERWNVCQLLDKKQFSYREISKMTGASLTTIGRVARFLNEENNGGYRKMLRKFDR